jgi:hypothetical protein
VIGLNIPIETPVDIKPYPPTHKHEEGMVNHDTKPDSSEMNKYLDSKNISNPASVNDIILENNASQPSILPSLINGEKSATLPEEPKVEYPKYPRESSNFENLNAATVIDTDDENVNLIKLKIVPVDLTKQAANLTKSDKIEGVRVVQPSDLISPSETEKHPFVISDEEAEGKFKSFIFNYNLTRYSIALE